MAGNRTLTGRSVASKLFAVLDAFEGSPRSLRLTDIVVRSGLPMPTALRMVRELVSWGGLERSGDGSYRIGARMWSIGNTSPCLRKLRELGQPHLHTLASETRAGAHLAVRDGQRALVLDRQGHSPHLPPTPVGARLPLHNTAVGRVLLAHGDQSLVEEVVRAGLTPAPTRYTVTTPARLLRELHRVRVEGVAVVREEQRLGLTQVAAAVHHPTQGVIAAIGVDLRSTSAITARTLDLVRAAARGMQAAVAVEAARQAG